MRRAGPLLAAVALAAPILAAAAVLAPAPAFAADPTFERATTTQKFGEQITVEQRVTLPSGVTRVEAYVRTNDGGGTLLSDIENPGTGAHTLRYTDETPPGSLMPNTQVELGFRITLADGSFVDSPPGRVIYADDRFTWQTIEGDVLRLHWYEGTSQFAQRALDIGEKAVKEAAELLGVEESLPIDFFIYPERNAFYDVIGPALQENVGGLAISEIRTLFANIAPSDVADPWVSLVVPHELTHIVFDTATRNPYHEPPHWLNEGLADYLAIGYASDARVNVERAVRDDELMPLHALELRFPSTAARFSLGYDESVSAVDYMVRTHGQDALVSLIRSYADGLADDDAFFAALGVDVAGFEAGWLGDLGADVPVPYGPKPAPPGPLPPGWVAAPIATGPPVATPPPGSGPGSGPGGGDADDPAVALIVGVGLLFLIVVVLGIVIVARGLNRGDPLLPPPGWTPPPDEPPPDGLRQDEPPPGPGFLGYDPDRTPGTGAPAPSDPELPPDLAELDARLAPPRDEPADEPANNENRRDDRP